MVFGHITEEILRGVGVGEVVGIEGEAVSCMIKAGQADDSVEDVRAAEEEVGSMHCTHGATGCHEGFAFVITNIRKQFLNDVVEPTFMLLNTPARIATKVRPGFPVNAIHTDDANLACFDPRSQYMYHTLIGIVEETTILTRECNKCMALIAKRLVFHVAIEVATVPFMIFYLHSYFLLQMSKRNWSFSSQVRKRAM